LANNPDLPTQQDFAITAAPNHAQPWREFKMAIRVFKRTYSAAIPEDAERCETTVTRRGKKQTVPAVRFRDASTNKKTTCPLTDDGQFMLRESEYFYGTVGGKRVCLEVSRKDVAEAKLADLIARHERSEAGFVSPFAKFEAMPIAQHVEDWRQAMCAKGNSAKHVRNAVARVEAILGGCNVNSTRDPALCEWADKAMRWLALERDGESVELPQGESFSTRELSAHLGITPGSVIKGLHRAGLPVANSGQKTAIAREHAVEIAKRSKKSMSAATSNHHLVSLKTFTNWLVTNRRIAMDPLKIAKRVGVTRDRRHDRRVLTSEEFTRLIQATGASEKTIQGLSGPDRRMLYLLLSSTGLRLRAAMLLTPNNYQLDARPATLTVPAHHSKNKKVATKILPSALVPSLKKYLEPRNPELPLFAPSGKVCDSQPIAMLRHDLKSAGIPYSVTDRDNVTRYADFHSLKHKFISDLVAAGVPMATIRELADHASITTTQRYCHSDQDQKTKAVESLNLPSLEG
jgi:site-specific recombinase XerD